MKILVLAALGFMGCHPHPRMKSTHEVNICVAFNIMKDPNLEVCWAHGNREAFDVDCRVYDYCKEKRRSQQ